MNNVSKVKIPKSDLEHVLINHGPSKKKHEESNNSSLPSKPENPTKTIAEVKTKPVRLNRKPLNLELNSSLNNSRQSQVKRNSNVVNMKSNPQGQHKNILSREVSLV